MTIKARATIEDLYHVPENGKAELVDGEFVRMLPTGVRPGRAGGEIYFGLRLYERQVGGGIAFPDNVGFVVNLPHRQSVSPDAAWYAGTAQGMRFLNAPPTFAAEIRSENDYGDRADRDIADKRADYFAAGTLVLWDVDLLGEDVIKVYRSTAPDVPTIYRRGDIAEAEPAVPDWTLPVDDLFA
jgi:Uma2 family endonuclease